MKILNISTNNINGCQSYQGNIKITLVAFIVDLIFDFFFLVKKFLSSNLRNEAWHFTWCGVGSGACFVQQNAIKKQPSSSNPPKLLNFFFYDITMIEKVVDNAHGPWLEYMMKFLKNK